MSSTSTSSSDQNQPGRNTHLDGIRGLAALAVAMGHCNLFFTGLDVWRTTLPDFSGMAAWQILARLWYVVFPADAAVMIFFVLSGYVLSRALKRRAHDWRQEAPIYAMRRFFRLYPVCILSGAMLILMIWLRTPEATPSWWHAIGTLLMIDHSVNGVLWSLKVEMVGSALIFLLWAIDSTRLCLVMAASLLLLAFGLGPALHAGGIDLNPEKISMASQLCVFLVAFVLGHLLPQVPQRLWQYRSLLIATIAILIGSDLLVGKTIAARLLEIIAAFYIVGYVGTSGFSFLDSRPIQFLGNTSYPFYLLHASAVLIVEPMLLWFPMEQMHVIAKASILAALSCTVGLALAWIMHMAVEKPGITLGNKISHLISKLTGKFSGLLCPR